MKKALIILTILLSLKLVSASVMISEFESNPAGRDYGNEWVELYSFKKINLDGWKLVNNDGDEYNLFGYIDGFMIVNFPGYWLDNSEERVFLYNSTGDLVDATPMVDDGDNDNKTWQKLKEWEFNDSTKGKPNFMPADVKQDCRINILDLILLRNYLGQDAVTFPHFDLNNNGHISIGDFLVIRDNLGNKC